MSADLREATAEKAFLRSIAGEQTSLYLAFPEETSPAEAGNLYRELLAAEERERAERFLSDQHRHDFIVARALVRLGLSSYFAVAPNEWCFGRDENEKPFVLAHDELPPFQFSLSHTRGLIALLVTFASQAGVDVEMIERTNDLHLVAEKICAPSELASLARLAGAAWRERFFQLWTLKEAYAKATGQGLALPFQSVAFRIPETGRIIFETAEGQDHGNAWDFSLHHITPLHLLATAIRGMARRAPSPLSIRKVRIGRFAIERCVEI